MSNNRYRQRGNSYRSRGARNNGPTTRLRGLFSDGIWHCDCTPRLPAERFKVKKEGKNQGRWFYTCQQSDSGCRFFLWEDDAKPREAAAVLSGSRTEPRASAAQARRDAGPPGGEIQGRGMFAGSANGLSRQDDASTASPSPPPSYRSIASLSNGAKRTAAEADLDDDEFNLDATDEQQMAQAMDSIETPQKAQETGVYATPATSTRRKLPWVDQPTTPAQTDGDYFATPSKQKTTNNTTAGPATPIPPPTVATASSPSPPTRFKDALHNPADSSSSLTAEVLSTLSSSKLPAQTVDQVRSICTKHDLRYQGVIKGRDISRLAIKAKDARIVELQARIASLEAQREVERELSRMRRYESGAGKG